MNAKDLKVKAFREIQQAMNVFIPYNSDGHSYDWSLHRVHRLFQHSNFTRRTAEVSFKVQLLTKNLDTWSPIGQKCVTLPFK